MKKLATIIAAAIVLAASADVSAQNTQRSNSPAKSKTVRTTKIVKINKKSSSQPYRAQDPDPTISPTNHDADENIIEAKRLDETSVVEETENASQADDNKVFDTVEQPPQFPGGQAALMKYVGDNLRYPQVALENGIQGRVIVSFVVTKTGSIGQVKVVRGKDPDLDKEAKRIVKSLPKFTPGKMNGHAVNVWYTLPITFRLGNV